MALTVGFDATAAVQQSAGIGRYVRQLLAALDVRKDDCRYRVFYCGRGENQGRLPELDARFHVRGLPLSDRALNIVWHRLRLPLPVQLVTGSIDLFHSPDFTLAPVPGRPTVVTVHDLAFLTVPECAYPPLRSFLEQVVPASARRATRIIAVSEQTRRDLIDLLQIPAERVTTVYEGVDPLFQPAPDLEPVVAHLRRLGLDRPYVLSVGTLQPRKNYVRLLEAYASARQEGLRHRLVIAGGLGWMYEPIFQRIKELQLEQWVSIIHPTDDVLLTMYQAADAFVYPSLYEGFGLPPLEAMACGVPVACSCTSSLPEVVQDAAVLFDPLDIPGMAQALLRVSQDGELRAELTRRGPKQAAAFSWDRAAAETLRVYREIAHHG